MMTTAVKLQPKAALNFRQAVEAAGMPKDQLQRFLSFGYAPQSRQMRFHAACREADLIPLSIGFGGARGGAKTHATFAQISLDDCQRRDGLKFLFLRKVAKSARESIADLRRKVLPRCPHEYKEQSGTIKFKNDSHIILGHFNYEKDIDQYLGLEYDGIAIEEATQLSEAKRKDILTCLRTSRTDWRVRDYNTTNPGGVGHNWFKRVFIEPYRKNRQTNTRFIPSTVYDNKMVDVDYRGKLENLTGWKRGAWLEGDWDIAAGQFFTNFRYDLHVVKPFEIPSHWPVWASLDYGFNHPTVCHLFAKNDGRIFIIGEYGERKKLVPSHAAAIKQLFARCRVDLARVNPFVAGQDAFAQRGNESGKTIADQYKDFGITLTPANTDRISGAGQVLGLLGDAENNIEPKLFIFDTCPRLIEQLPMMQHDPNRPEDVLKVDIDDDGNGGDDYYDSARYGVMVLPYEEEEAAGTSTGYAF
jgi:phage terminase large subunit